MNERIIEINPIIFKEISQYLAIGSTFEEILELSLLSKSTFKLFQNLITSYQYNQNEFCFPIDLLIEYIQHSTREGTTKETQETSYQFKLIQYKELESIKVDEISKYCYGLFNVNKNSNICKEIQEFLNIHCSKLKQVELLNRMRCIPNIDYDYTCGGFFKVNVLSMIWNFGNPPVSHGEQLPLCRGDYKYFPFSFEFLTKYNPVQLIIGTGEYASAGEQCNFQDGDNLYLFKLENILNCKSIKSIDFKNQSVDVNNLKAILNTDSTKQATIESLSISSVRDDGRTTIYHFEHCLSEAGFENNTTLKKLILISQDTPDCELSFKEKDDDENLNENIISSVIVPNKSIHTLGLLGFGIFDNSYLESLLKCENITTLQVDTHCIEAALDHCEENNNIKELNFVNLDPYGSPVIKKSSIKLISDFLLKSKKHKSPLNPYSIKFIDAYGFTKTFEKVLSST